MWWKSEIEAVLGEHGEAWVDVEAIAGDLSRDPYEGGRGASWTVWTSRRVYFPTSYDGHYRVASVPRHPCQEAIEAF